MRNKMFKSCGLITAVSLLFSGCGFPENPAEASRDVLPASLKTLSFEEHLDITIGYWDIDAVEKASAPDDMTRYIEDLFNVTLHPVSVSWSNYKERYQILSAMQSLPDIFATVTLSSRNSNDSAFFTDMIDDGSIRALPEDLSPYPVLSSILDSVSYTEYKDGSYYAIPRISFTDSSLGSTDAAMLVRKDWRESLGISVPETPDEFADMVAAFAREDPDGNGVSDTIGYNVNNLEALGKWVILGIAPECNVYSWIEKDGRYVPSWTTEEFKEVAAFYRKLYESGGLDPAFYSKPEVIVQEDFAAGRLGALEYKSSPGALMETKERWDAMNDKPFEECVEVLPVFPAGDGVRYSNSSGPFWSESYLSSAVDDEKAERILAILEFLLSEQGQAFCHYGLEGIDYIRTSDGNYQCLLDVEEGSLGIALKQKYPSIVLFAGLAGWSGGDSLDFEENDANALLYGKACMRLAHDSARWNRLNTTQLDRPYDFLFFPKEPSDKFSTSQAFDAFVSCIIGSGDPVKMWEQYLDSLYEQGLEEYIVKENEHFREGK